MYKRKIEATLLDWKQTANHKPLVIKGCRQCGKTSSVVAFAKANYAHVVYLDFHEHKEYKAFFTGALEGVDDESHLQTFERKQTDLRFMDYLEYKGYKGSVEYSKEDNCLFGKVQGLPKALILYEGQTLEELRRDFEDGIDDYIDGCRADGIEPCKPFSGRLNLRMTSDLHSRVAAFAASKGITINDFINRAIQNEMAHQMAV